VGLVMCECVYVWVCVCVCVCVGFVMCGVFLQLCGCFGNVCTCIYCVLVLFPLCIFILICYYCKDYSNRVKTQLQ